MKSCLAFRSNARLHVQSVLTFHTNSKTASYAATESSARVLPMSTATWRVSFFHSALKNWAVSSIHFDLIFNNHKDFKIFTRPK